MKEEDKQYLSQVGMYLADLFYNQKNINMKEETLEEAAARYTCGWGEDDDEKAFIAGAKWQSERMYSKEDVVKIVEKSRETGLTAEFLLLTFKSE